VIGEKQMRQYKITNKIIYNYYFFHDEFNCNSTVLQNIVDDIADVISKRNIAVCDLKGEIVVGSLDIIVYVSGKKADRIWADDMPAKVAMSNKQLIAAIKKSKKYRPELAKQNMVKKLYLLNKEMSELADKLKQCPT
jgi:hypothetical protein